VVIFQYQCCYLVLISLFLLYYPCLFSMTSLVFIFLVIATFGYLLSLFVLIFLCQAVCGCSDGTRFCCLSSECFSKFAFCF